ncbi:hypothetical protein BZA05DRAFT_405860 [Tricharina praecox]|uniref:uncharacterized protein n=1 Tax=Tricharina praecox TaxID=43433 RepID=UPI00221F010E|nr:uncharacterized protein BZA05DRAFT_405860 [Tricharina praecox]KAI5846918.1 hypothetical protein BZA05DRAFT_405860 [Tricharina praecox]
MFLFQLGYFTIDVLRPTYAAGRAHYHMSCPSPRTRTPRAISVMPRKVPRSAWTTAIRTSQPRARGPWLSRLDGNAAVILDITSSQRGHRGRVELEVYYWLAQGGLRDRLNTDHEHLAARSITCFYTRLVTTQYRAVLCLGESRIENQDGREGALVHSAYSLHTNYFYHKPRQTGYLRGRRRWKLQLAPCNIAQQPTLSQKIQNGGYSCVIIVSTIPRR